MDINGFLQAFYITSLVLSVAGVITEAMLGKGKGINDCSGLHWYAVLLCLLPVANTIVAALVWSSIIVNDTPPSPPSCGADCLC